MTSIQDNEFGSVSEHIGELRNKILIALVAFVIGAVIAHFFRDELMAFILKPTGGQNLVFLSPLEPFFFILKIDFFGGLVISFPVIMWAIFSYVTPALPEKAGKLVNVFYIASTILLFVGLVYAFFVTIPLSLKFLFSIVIPGIENSFSVEKYMGFIMTQALLMMAVFQTPILIIGGSYLDILDPSFLASKRRYIYAVLLTALAILTPTTDMFSLLIVFVPCLVIFEISLFISKIIANRKAYYTK